MLTKYKLQVFSHNTYSGSRTQFELPVGTKVKDVDVDMNDPLYGEPVVWFDALVRGLWRTVGVINMPVLAKGWQAKVFGEDQQKTS